MEYPNDPGRKAKRIRAENQKRDPFGVLTEGYHCERCDEELGPFSGQKCQGCGANVCASCITAIPRKNRRDGSGYKWLCKICLAEVRGRCECPPDFLMPISLAAFPEHKGRGSACVNCGRVWEATEIGALE